MGQWLEAVCKLWIWRKQGEGGKTLGPDFLHHNNVVGNKAPVAAIHFQSFFESFCCRPQDFAGSFPKFPMTRGHVIEI
jgi:hypothetical protein